MAESQFANSIRCYSIPIYRCTPCGHAIPVEHVSGLVRNDDRDPKARTR
jgi:hypothetical protein